MTKYKIKGNLIFDDKSQLGLKSPLSYSEGSSLKVIIEDKDKGNKLDIKLIIQSKDKDSAIIKAENQLERVSSLISWFHEIPVVDWDIESVEFSEKEGSKSKIVMVNTLKLSMKFSIKKMLDNTSLKETSKKLEKKYNSDFFEILIMWRQALSEKSKGLSYFLFYKILEKLCGGSKKVDKFIKANDDNVKMKSTRNGKITIFTFLRDNIHPKTAEFPYNEIEKYLPQLKKITRKRIKEQLGELNK